MEYMLNNLIDENFIKIYHSDLSNMTTNRLKQHYITKGHKEGRTLSNLHVQQILRNRYFNIEFYKTHYDDVKDMNPTQLVNQYIQFGQKEGRIVSKKHASILTNNPEFDIDFYKSNHPDLHNMSPSQLVRHYIDAGKTEGRIVSKKHASILTHNPEFDVDFYKSHNPDLQNMFPDKLVTHYINNGKQEGRICSISLQKICIIYIYYEIKNKQQNQNNLAFFIKYGLDKSRWRDMNITTLFIIKGQQCEVVLPNMDNVHILYNTNKHDDETLYKTGIDYFTNKYNTTICNLFTHVCLINGSNFGPNYANTNKYCHWLDPLINGSSINNTSQICNKLPIIDFNKSNIFGKYDDNFLKGNLNYKESIFDISKYKVFFNKPHNKCIIYAHYDKDNIIKQYVLETLAIFAQLGYDILFYTTSSMINNYDSGTLPFKINYFELNYGAGTDWHMWLAGCKQLKSQSNTYDWVTLINDSMLIGINGIENMRETIREMEHKDLDFWGHWDSNELNYHVMSSFYVLKYSIINHYIMFCEQFLLPCKTKKDIIYKCETKFTLYLKSRACKTGVVIEETSLPHLDVHTPSHNPVNIDSWINNKRAFGIKWKYVLEHLANKDINNEFKERCRLIYIGKSINITSIFKVK